MKIRTTRAPAATLFPMNASHSVMGSNDSSKDVVMSYIGALDGQEYEKALNFLHDSVRIRGPGGESFGKPTEFVEILRRYKGRYDIKKVFADGEDVCVIYDLATTGPTVFMSSWYQVNDGKIVSIRTIFDPSAFSPPTGRKTEG